MSSSINPDIHHSKNTNKEVDRYMLQGLHLRFPNLRAISFAKMFVFFFVKFFQTYWTQGVCGMEGEDCCGLWPPA